MNRDPKLAAFKPQTGIGASLKLIQAKKDLLNLNFLTQTSDYKTPSKFRMS
ncbi:hypothetical protein LIHA111178_04855 [Litorimonas haliclonae]